MTKLKKKNKFTQQQNERIIDQLNNENKPAPGQSIDNFYKCISLTNETHILLIFFFLQIQPGTKIIHKKNVTLNIRLTWTLGG